MADLFPLQASTNDEPLIKKRKRGRPRKKTRNSIQKSESLTAFQSGDGNTDDPLAKADLHDEW